MFLLALVALWKETPTVTWVTFDKVRKYIEEKGLPAWCMIPIICIAMIYRPKGKAFVLCSIGTAGFVAIGIVWGSDIFDFILRLIEVYRKKDEV